MQGLKKNADQNRGLNLTRLNSISLKSVSDLAFRTAKINKRKNRMESKCFNKITSQKTKLQILIKKLNIYIWKLYKIML